MREPNAWIIIVHWTLFSSWRELGAGDFWCPKSIAHKCFTIDDWHFIIYWLQCNHNEILHNLKSMPRRESESRWEREDEKVREYGETNKLNTFKTQVTCIPIVIDEVMWFVCMHRTVKYIVPSINSDLSFLSSSNGARANFGIHSKENPTKIGSAIFWSKKKKNGWFKKKVINGKGEMDGFYSEKCRKIGLVLDT